MVRCFLLGFLFLLIYCWGMGCSSVGRADGAGIVIIAVGSIDRQILTDLSAGLKESFGVGVAIGRSMPEPDYALDPKRGQYASSRILAQVQHEREASVAGKILAVVDHDLYVPDLNFVFGEASPRVSVISLTRLRQSFYGLLEEREIFYQRILTEAVHELGHSYGLAHCPDPKCVMFFSNCLADTDRKGARFCAICRRKLDVFMVAALENRKGIRRQETAQ